MNKLSRKSDATKLSAEISGIAMIVDALSLQLTDDNDRLNDGPLSEALWSISSYLERIAEDLGEL